MRHSIVKAGVSINMQARKHVDVSSTDEGVRIKSDKNTYIYSHNAGVLIESAGSTDTFGHPDPDKKKRALDYVGGVVIKSNLGIYNYAQKNILNYAKGQLLLQSLKNTEILAGTFLNIYGRKQANLFSDKTIIIKAGATLKWVDRDTKKVIEKRSSGNVSIISEGAAVIAGATSTSLGGKGSPVNVVGIGRHAGVVDVEKYVTTSGIKKFLRSREDLVQYTVFKKERREQPHFKRLEDIKFRFLESYRYGDITQDSTDEKKDGIPGTLAQQEDLTTKRYGFESWDEKFVNESVPYPGFIKEKKFYYAPPKLFNLEKNAICTDLSSKANPGAVSPYIPSTEESAENPSADDAFTQDPLSDTSASEENSAAAEEEGQANLRKYLNKESPSPYGDEEEKEEEEGMLARKSFFKKYKVFKFNERDPDPDRDLSEKNEDIDSEYTGPFVNTAYEKRHFINSKGNVVEDYDETVQDDDEEKPLIEDEEALKQALKIPQIKIADIQE